MISSVRYFLSIIALCTIFVSYADRAYAQGKGEIVITVKPNQSIRDIAKEYLKDPDLWEDILRVNNLKSASEIREGVKLRIPVQAISQGKSKLDKSHKIIQKATKIGAKIFAADAIGKAISFRNEAIAHRKAGDWQACISSAKSAIVEANKAHKICLSKQDVKGEAIVKHREGKVQSRTPAENTWQSVPQDDYLIEGEKIRTLSASFVEILFSDESRIRLSENSQALIKRMRSNLLKNTAEASISLIQGDVMALLASSKAKSKFNLNVKGVDTKINSKKFWISKNDKVAKFANYDGEIEISSGGKSVTLKKNMGSVVKAGKAPEKPKKLLPAPILVSPENNIELFAFGFSLNWEKATGAVKYKVEVARDASFSQIIYTVTAKGQSKTVKKNLGVGQFYWRVSAISSEGIPGNNSVNRSFLVIADDEPPFLLLTSPRQDTISRSSTIIISGITEPDVAVTVMGAEVVISADSKFSHKLVLNSGVNLVKVVVTDRAGNITEKALSINYISDDAYSIAYDPNLISKSPKHFMAINNGFTLSGITEPASTVKITSASGTVRSRSIANQSGEFQMNLMLREVLTTLYIETKSKTGVAKRDTIKIEIDDQPPVILLDNAIASSTNNKILLLTGTVDGGESLKLHGKPIELVGSRFEHEITLKRGSNSIKLEARDLVQNVSFFEKDVYFDPDPPKYVRHTLSIGTVVGGEQVKITLSASDASGLKETCTYSLSIAGQDFDGYLKYSQTDRKFSGMFQVPPGVKGAIGGVQFEVADRLGNVAVLKP